MERKPMLMLTAHQQPAAIKCRGRGELVREIARTYNISHCTIPRLKGSR
ncbi:DNA-invertase from lambdoid prophage e14 (fragment) [Methylocella tundrae]|uniref:DNA-invertase from lambdoid prophage e14 n=1 Tax=Methylocella tundrae TaxID=227605 RepID=A0A8B6M8T6_METTU